MRVAQRSHARVIGGVEVGEALKVLLAADPQAPGAARSIVVRHLGGVVAPSVLDGAPLLISELFTNSVRHSGAAAGEQLMAMSASGKARVGWRSSIAAPMESSRPGRWTGSTA